MSDCQSALIQLAEAQFNSTEVSFLDKSTNLTSDGVLMGLFTPLQP